PNAIWRAWAKPTGSLWFNQPEKLRPAGTRPVRRTEAISLRVILPDTAGQTAAGLEVYTRPAEPGDQHMTRGRCARLEIPKRIHNQLVAERIQGQNVAARFADITHVVST